MSDARTPERIRAHYEIEVKLADRLREASPDQRRGLYGRVYDELFGHVPDHPQLTRRAEPADQTGHASEQVGLLRQFLPPGGTYVEIGAGDCATVRLVAAFAKSVRAVDVSAEIMPADLPRNVEVALTDGVSIPVPPGSADLIYSNQLMEHLHPDDAHEQLRNIAQSLKPGGRYICITPNRLTGPHDISRGFDRHARGFHLHEYTHAELTRACLDAGFRRVRVLERPRGRAFSHLLKLVATANHRAANALMRAGERALVLPLGPYLFVERIAGALPRGVRDLRLLRRLLGIRIIAQR